MAKSKKAPEPGSVELKNKNHELFCRLYAGNKFGKLFGNATRSYKAAFAFDDEIEKNIEKLVVLEEKKSMLWKKGEREEHAKVKKEVDALYARNKSLEKSAATLGERLLRKVEILERIDFLFDQYLDPAMADREMAFVIAQRDDLMSKVSAYDKVMKVRGRINDKLSGELVVKWEDDEEDEPASTPKGKKAAVKKVLAKTGANVRFMDDDEEN